MSFHDLIAAYGGEEEHIEGDASAVIVEKEKKSEEGLGLVSYDYIEEETIPEFGAIEKYNEDKGYSTDESLGMGYDTRFTPSPSIYSPSRTNLLSPNDSRPLNTSEGGVMSNITTNSSSNEPKTNYSSWKDDYPIDGLEVSSELLATVQKFRNLRRTGGNINRDLRRQKQFKNPDLIGRLISVFHVIEIGSNYDEEKFNPFQWQASSFAPSLAQAQAKLLEEEKKDEQARKDKQKKVHPRDNGRHNLDERDLKRRRNDHR